MSGTVLGHLDTILLQSCVVAMILFTDTEVQVRWLAPGHTAPLPDCIAPVLPFSLGASLWPFGPQPDDVRSGAPQSPAALELLDKGSVVTD